MQLGLMICKASKIRAFRRSNASLRDSESCDSLLGLCHSTLRFARRKNFLARFPPFKTSFSRQEAVEPRGSTLGQLLGALPAVKITPKVHISRVI